MDNGFIMSFSGGKDSTLALYRMIKKGYKPVALLTTLKKNKGKSWTHGITNSLLEKVSKSLKIPILKVECDIDEYETEFEKALIEGKKMGAQICVFGDIDIEEHKQWDILRCENTGFKAKFPLWQEDRGKLVYEFIDSGFTTIIKTINLKYLDEKYLGKVLDRSVVKEIELSGADICGENGEYHTFVINGPLFSQPIEFENKGKVLENGYAHLDIL